MKEFVERVSELVAIPSTADNPDALRMALEYVAGPVMATPELNVEWLEGGSSPSLLVYAGNSRPDEFDVLLNGHLDVVPGSAEQFQASIRGDRLYGRGAMDMKATVLGQIAVLCEMAPELKKMGRGKYPIEVGALITTNEETEVGNSNGAYSAVNQGGVAAKFVVVGESTEPHQICTAYKGFARAEIDFTGRAAHDSRPWDGLNAVEAAAKYVMDMLGMYPKPAVPVWRTTASTVGFSSNNRTWNQVPADAAVRTSFRFVAEDERFASAETLQAVLQELAPGAEVSMHAFEPAGSIDPSHKRVRQLTASILSAQSRLAEIIHKHGSCDGRYWKDAVVFGMAGGGIHGDDEFLDLTSVEPHLNTMRRFLANLS